MMCTSSTPTFSMLYQICVADGQRNTQTKIDNSVLFYWKNHSY